MCQKSVMEHCSNGTFSAHNFYFSYNEYQENQDEGRQVRKLYKGYDTENYSSEEKKRPVQVV